jgi:hypothetical protein
MGSRAALKRLRPPKHRKLPVLLNREEVYRVLSAIGFPVYRACLCTIYSCGLRLSQGTFLKVEEYRQLAHDGAGFGLGSKERMSRCPNGRSFYSASSSPRTVPKQWLFPARIGHDGYWQPVKPKNVQTASGGFGGVGGVFMASSPEGLPSLSAGLKERIAFVRFGAADRLPASMAAARQWANPFESSGSGLLRVSGAQIKATMPMR